MFDERMAENYFHLISVLVPGFLEHVIAVTKNDSDFVHNHCEACARIQERRESGAISKMDSHARVQIARLAGKEMSRVATHLLNGFEGAPLLNEVQTRYMKKTSRRVGRYRDAMDNLHDASLKKLVETFFARRKRKS